MPRPPLRDLDDEALLESGFSVGEGLLVALLIGVLLVFGLSHARVAIAHSTQMEALFLAAGPKSDWLEHWAVTGDLPVRAGAPISSTGAQATQLGSGLPLHEGPLAHYVVDVDRQAVDGAVVFTMKGDASPAPQIGFRAAFGPSDAPASLLWLCGRAPVPAGFVRVGDNHTTVDRKFVPSSCRGEVSATG